MPSQEDGSAERGRQAAAISNAMVGLLHEYTGRGPTRAKTTIAEDVVVCVVHDTLTRGERKLVSGGEGLVVLAARRAVQGLLREEAVATVEDISGRRVIAFMSENHIAPDLAVETFVLEPKSKESQASSYDGSETGRPRSPKHRRAGDQTAPHVGDDRGRGSTP
jgi:uncharacterized protein YbcI